MRIAAAACVMVSGLFVAGAGAAMAFADPEAGQGGQTGGTQSDPTGGVATEPTSAQTPVEGATTEPTSATTATASAPKPTSQLGGGRNGLPSAELKSTPSAEPSSKPSEPRLKTTWQTKATATGEPTKTTTGTTIGVPVPTGDDSTTDENPPRWNHDGPWHHDPDEHQGWHWPWCWPNPPDPGQPPGSGSPPSSGSGGGGGVSIGKPPVGIGIPKPPPLMQLPVPTLPRVVPPTLPVISVDPVVDVINGLATAAAELPFSPLTLPVLVPPLGAGGPGAGGSGGAARPGTPSAPRNSGSPQNKNEPPKAGQQNPPAYGASNGVVPASYRAGYGDYLRTAGVGQMAAVAVPGVTGILVLTGAGGLVGYRQARAGHTVRANATARFMG
jgi:hypothetical protein